MTHQQAQPFDENAALAELERLRQAIMAARRLRQQKSDEFEAFVQGFRNPVRVPPAERSVPPMPRIAAPEQVARPPVVAPPPANLQAPVALPSTADAPAEVAAPANVPASGRTRINKPWAFGIGGAIAVIALVVLTTRSGNQPPPPAPVDTVASEPAAPAPAETPAASTPEPTAATATQPDTHAVVLDLRTLRSVWMRVTVDGQKKSEGMVQGGESLHLGADDSIVVRVGNGGDVVVRNGGREDPFGAPDQPLTRRFSKR